MIQLRLQSLSASTRTSWKGLRNSSLNRGFHVSRTPHFELTALTLEPLHHAIQYVQATTGLSWHWMIPLTTVTLRTAVTLPIAILNRRRNQKQAELQPLLGAMTPIIRARLAQSDAAREGVLTYEQIQVLSMKERRRRRIELFKRHKCQAWKSLVLLPSVQMPLWISMSMVFRAMCGWSVVSAIPVEPAFQNDSWLWIPDLITSDPYGILPLFIGCLSLANVEWNTINMMNAQQRRGVQASGPSGPSVPKIVSNLSRVGVLFFMTASFQAPAAVCLYWVSSSGFSLIQNVAFDYFLPLNQTPKTSVATAIPFPNTVETRTIS